MNDEKNDIWREKPELQAISGFSDRELASYTCYSTDKIDAFHEKLKAHYAPYDELLKVDPFIPRDIERILEKGGMSVLIDEEWFNGLKEKAEKWNNYLVDASRVPESA